MPGRVRRLLWPRTTHGRSYGIGTQMSREIMFLVTWVSGLVLVCLTGVRRSVYVPIVLPRRARGPLCRTIWTEYPSHSFESRCDLSRAPILVRHLCRGAGLKRLGRLWRPSSGIARLGGPHVNRTGVAFSFCLPSGNIDQGSCDELISKEILRI